MFKPACILFALACIVQGETPSLVSTPQTQAQAPRLAPDLSRAVTTFIEGWNGTWDKIEPNQFAHLRNIQHLYGPITLTGHVLEAIAEPPEARLLLEGRKGTTPCRLYVPFSCIDGVWNPVLGLAKMLPGSVQEIQAIRALEPHAFTFAVDRMEVDADADTQKAPYLSLRAKLQVRCGREIDRLRFVLPFAYRVTRVACMGGPVDFEREAYTEPIEDYTPFQIVSFVPPASQEVVRVLTIEMDYQPLEGRVLISKGTDRVSNNKTELLVRPGEHLSTAFNDGATSFLPVPLTTWANRDAFAAIPTWIRPHSKEGLVCLSGGIDASGRLASGAGSAVLIASKMPFRTFTIRGVECLLAFSPDLPADKIEAYATRLKTLITTSLDFCEFMTSIPLKEITPRVSFIFLPPNLSPQNAIMNADHTIILTDGPFTDMLYEMDSKPTAEARLHKLFTHELSHCWFGNTITAVDDLAMGMFSQGHAMVLETEFKFLTYPQLLRTRDPEIYASGVYEDLGEDLGNAPAMGVRSYKRSSGDREYAFTTSLLCTLGLDTARKVWRSIMALPQPPTVQEIRALCEAQSGKPLAEFFDDYLYRTKVRPYRFVKKADFKRYFSKDLTWTPKGVRDTPAPVVP